MTRLILAERSNWETIAFLLINRIAGKSGLFNRAQIMKNIDMAVLLSSRILGHKKNPDHPEETLQKTMQNLRDKGFIDFLGRGEYKLTATGHERMKHVVETVQSAFNSSPDDSNG